MMVPHLRRVAATTVRLASALALTATLTASAALAQSSGPNVSQFTLANGLELVVIPDHRTPAVTHMVWYKVGAADETPGKSGLAHFLEHLMFKGTAKNPTGRFSLAVAALGAHENAFTSNDYTGYYQRVPSDQLKSMMEFEADRMTGLSLTDKVVLPERDVILEEQNLRVANNPHARLAEQVDAALFLNHPYGKPTIGWRHEMEQLSRDDAIGFYRRFYAPNNAVVVIAGDVEPDFALKLAEETYGKLPANKNIVPRLRPQEPPPVAVRSLTLADPRVEQPMLQRAYLVPSFTTAKPGQSEALEVLSLILGTGENSRLYRALVVDKHVAVAAGTRYDSAALDMTRFSLFAMPRSGTSLPQLEGEIDAVIAAVIDKGVDAEELARAKTRLIADVVYAQDNQMSLARWYGVALTTGSTVDDVRRWPDRVRAVTAEQVQEAARLWLDKRRSVTGYLVKDKSPLADKAPQAEKTPQVEKRS
jgi:zinc protease